MEAKLDGFRMYKIKNRGDPQLEMVNGVARKYVAPIYVCGLPGDVAAFNRELELESTEFTHLMHIDNKRVKING